MRWKARRCHAAVWWRETQKPESGSHEGRLDGGGLSARNKFPGGPLPPLGEGCTILWEGKEASGLALFWKRVGPRPQTKRLAWPASDPLRRTREGFSFHRNH